MPREDRNINLEDDLLELIVQAASKLSQLTNDDPELLQQLDDPDPAYDEWAAAYYRGVGDVVEIAKRLDTKSGFEDDFWQRRAEIADALSGLLKRRPLGLPETE